MGQFKNRNDAIDAILRRSAVDAGFRHRLLVDPAGAVEDVAGRNLSDGLRLRFVEKPKDVDAVLVLPDSIEDDGLSDEELEAVAGGVEGDDGDGIACDGPPPKWTCFRSCGTRDDTSNG